VGLYYVHKTRVEPRFRVIYVLLGVVGVGSVLFHLTLRYELQMADELPMTWGLLGWVYILANNERPAAPGLRWPVGLAVYGILATMFFIAVTDDYPVLLQLEILVGMMWSVARITAFYNKLAANPAHCALRGVFMVYAVAGICGFICWILDNGLCPFFSSLPFGLPNPQLHAWWHVLMAVNCYLGPVIVIYSRTVVLGRHPEIKCSPLLPYTVSHVKEL